MKFLFCDNRLGGLLGFRIDVIRHFVRQGHEVVLVCPQPATEWDRIGQNDLQNVRIVYVPMDANGLDPLKDLHLILSYWRLFRQERPDWIFTYTIKPNIYGGIAARLLHIPVVSVIAGLGYAFLGESVLKKMLQTLYRVGLKKVKQVLVLNKSNYDVVLTHFITTPSKIVLLEGGEGVNLDRYSASETDFRNGITFLVISRVLYDKGYQEFVDAVEQIPQKGNIHFQWLGPTAFERPFGVPQSTFEHDCRNRRFEYLGVATDVTQYMGRKDVVVVLPSYMEGMSRSLMEACAMGRPIITTDIPGCREMVDEGKNGFLVPPKDSKALADAMSRFISMPEEQKRAMAQHSHQLAVRRFDVRKVIGVYDAICGQDNQKRTSKTSTKYCILTPRFPFPENGGDVLRINYVARYLKQQGHSLCLVSFSDKQSDFSQANQLYDSIYTIPLRKWKSYLYSLLSFLLGKPMQCGYYRSHAYKKMLRGVIAEERPDRYLAHLLRMTPYLEQLGLQQQSIVEMTDALSKTYALVGTSIGNKRMRFIYQLEQRRIKRYEQKVAQTFPRVVLVSQTDVDYLQALCPSVTSLVCRSNGVECLPALPVSYQPFKLCFMGNMRTLQNQDAVLYFVEKVLPLILEQQPDAMFYIVGAQAPASIQALASEHVVVTGFVENVQAAIQDACVMAAPVNVAAGIQNKVLVSMGCGVPVVLTSLIARAIPELKNDNNCIIADTPSAMAQAMLALMSDPAKRNAIGQAGYQMVKQNYSWMSKLKDYESPC